MLVTMCQRWVFVAPFLLCDLRGLCVSAVALDILSERSGLSGRKTPYNPPRHAHRSA